MIRRCIKLLVLVFPICFIACNNSSGKKSPVPDSLEFYPKTPVGIEQELFRFYYRSLKPIYDTTLKEGIFSGGYIVAVNGTIILEKYQGFRDPYRRDSLDASTPLHLASVTKPLTSTAILRLVQENKISLQDSLSRFFPGLPYPGITIKMLLTHYSGIPNYVQFIPNSKWNKKVYVTNETVIKLLYKDKPKRSFPPGTKYEYSNTNFVLLATIVEKISGRSFPDYMKENFFVPLGMKDSYVFTLADSARASVSYTDNGNFWRNDYLDGTYGDKNIYTTPRDMLKWEQAFDHTRLINQSLIDSVFTPHPTERPSIYYYGLGWRIMQLTNGKIVHYHFGRWHGFTTSFVVLPEYKVTIIILGNRLKGFGYNAAIRSFNIFGEYWPKKQIIHEEKEDSK